MSDWTQEEYESILTHSAAGNPNTTKVETLGADTPVDLRDGTCVSPIQDQGQCGSCWAFSSVAAMETSNCYHGTKQLKKMSEQQLVDCDRTCFGCNGGLQQRAFLYYESHYAMSEASYPYKGTDGTCQYSSVDNTGIKATGYTFTTADDPNAMKTALASNYMLSVSIQAN